LEAVKQTKAEGTCRFCGQVGRLLDSHIIPEFVYGPLYGDDGILVALGEYPGGMKFTRARKGLREPLLCDMCEQVFNRSFEQPVVEVWRALAEDAAAPKGLQITPFGIATGDPGKFVTGLPYREFKLFLLSLLWRAHVSSRLEYADVELGPHAERIKRMLREGDAGSQAQYPCFVYRFEEPEFNAVSPFFRGRSEGHTMYQLVAASMLLVFMVSARRVADHLVRFAPKEDGSLVVPVISAARTPAVLGAAKQAQRTELPKWLRE
jgi:hypothetical protein